MLCSLMKFDKVAPASFCKSIRSKDRNVVSRDLFLSALGEDREYERLVV